MTNGDTNVMENLRYRHAGWVPQLHGAPRLDASQPR